ncbi:serine/threonine-protein kinase [Archangium sp.]|uniref:WD40 repeat domain-containing serine/threonine protein kinase n=1 Tax=Archangium sp. TaxID=1872627 RepID=UPI002869F5C7|nr:serine/threonine-protein kinase [Archangium sp.]
MSQVRSQGSGTSSESLDASEGGSDTTLRAPVPPRVAASPGEALPVVDPARYTIAGELAHGGIGRILRARDVQLDRPVAIKEMLTPVREAEARFVAEALVTARLQHPSIVPVYEAGRWPGGEPFYAMKLVSGRSLADVIAERTTLAARLALLPHVLAVAEAIAYAHTERIIHRDLKPANVLVGDFGETVVIDWGLAKDLSREDVREPVDTAHPSAGAEDGGLTQVGTVMGTPAYMPPEQAVGQPVDERADVYALGAILYHLLAGVQPYEGGASGQVLQRVVQGPPTPLGERQKGIPPDLLAIVAKAMSRAPAERYATARELAEDLRRFQTGQIVGAHHYSWGELVWRFVVRYRVAVGVTGVAALLLAGLGAVSFQRILEERNRAERKQVEAEAARTDAERARQEALAQADNLRLVQARNAVGTDTTEAIAWLRRLSPGFSRWSSVRTIAADARARGFATPLRGHSQVINALVFSRDGRWVVSTSDDYTLRLWDVERHTSRVLSGHTDEAWGVALGPDDRSVFSSGKDGTIRRWDLHTGEGRVFATLAGPVSAMGGSANGRRLFAQSRVDDLLYVWELESGQLRTFHTGQRGVELLLVSPDGRFVGLHTGELHVLLGDVERGTFQLLEDGGKAGKLAFSRGSELLAMGGPDGVLRAWEPRSGRLRLLGRPGQVNGLSFTPDGRHLVFATQDGVLTVLELATGQSRKLGVHEGALLGLDVSRDGRFCVSFGNGAASRLWSLATGESRQLDGAPEAVFATSFSPDGRLLATGSSDGTVRLSSVDVRSHRVLATASSALLELSLSPEGRRLATVGQDGKLRLFDMAEGTVLSEEGDAVRFLAHAPGGRWLASGDAAGRVFLREAASGRTERVLEGHASAVGALAFSREERWLASADDQGVVRLWSPASGEGRELGRHEGKVFRLVFSPEGGRLASVGQDRTVRVWDVGSGEARVLRGHEDAVTAVDFSPDGKRLVSGSKDHTLRFWDLESGQSQRRDASGGGILEVLFSPRGDVVVSRSLKDPRPRLWDGRTGEPQGLLRGHEADVLDLAFSPDGTRLTSAGHDKRVMLWDMATGEPRRLLGHTAGVSGVAFLPDGRSLVSIGLDGTVRLWPDELPWEQDALREWLATIPGSEP